MSTETVEQTDDYTAEIDGTHGIPIFTYNKYVSGEELRAVARRWAEIVEEENADRYLVNTEEIAAHNDEDKQWLGKTWVPNLIDQGVRAGAGVYADSVISKGDMERIEEKLNAIDPDYEYRTFGSQSKAVEWLAEQ
ncbi:hypothetical protein SAMN05216559_1352 [Halomicrobium zhouii]|uniref:SpoIIAA-like n=1 Tax=Halomicrobium zhouii TaxID=767519 RepID=A0A1I6KR68_9EURY|nr:hypothetical protein [Halomicrobium zhouii]SFR93691.1 hypothetical protein SAMN05216559_1352 [Halomicrobium zhouii]